MDYWKICEWGDYLKISPFEGFFITFILILYDWYLLNKLDITLKLYNNDVTKEISMTNFPLRLAHEFKAELKEKTKKDKRSLTKFIENILEKHVENEKSKGVQKWHIKTN